MTAEESRTKVWPITYQSILDDFKHFPDALKSCSDFYFSELGKDLFDRTRTILDSIEFERVVFIGNTYNYFASYIPRYCFMKCEKHLTFSWELFELNEFYDYILPTTKDESTLYIFISKSGISKRIKKAIDHLSLFKIDPNKIWLVTNEQEHEITRKCGLVFPINAGSELVVGTKSFQNSVFVLFLIAQLLMGNNPLSEGILTNVESLITSMRKFWEKNDVITDEVIEFIGQDLKYLYIISKGASLSSAHEAAASAKSYAHFLTEGISMGLFFFGPFQIADENFRSVIIVGDDLDEDSNVLLPRLIYQITRRSGALVLLSNNMRISEAVKINPLVYIVNYNCPIPALSPIFDMLVLHRIFLEISKIKGLVL